METLYIKEVTFKNSADVAEFSKVIVIYFFLIAAISVFSVILAIKVEPFNKNHSLVGCVFWF